MQAEERSTSGRRKGKGTKSPSPRAARRQTRSRATASTDHPVTAYAKDVCDGRIIAGPIVRDACARHLRDLVEGPARGLTFSEERANYGLEFFPTALRLNGGQFEGKPFELAPAQAFIVGSVWGWLNADGFRRFRVVYVEQGKGNGKSPLAGGIGLLGLVADNEPRAEIYAAATKKDQAMILFRDAVAMVDQSPPLAKVLDKSGRAEKVWNLYHARSGSFFRPISSDDGQSGPRPHIGLLDEVHEHRTNNMVEMMRAGFKSRRQPLIFMITNSGHDQTSVCWDYHDYARQVNAGELDDDGFFGYVCALDEGDDPFKEEDCWIKANPLLGRTIELDYLRDQVREARGMPSKESIVRRLNFCQWTQAHNPLIPGEAWEASRADFKLEFLRGLDCCLGLDLSSTTDLTAAVFVARREGKFWWWPEFWIPEGLLQKKVEKDKVPYDVWKRQGWLRTTPGNAIDLDFVATDIKRLRALHGLKLVDVPYDRWRIDDFKSACQRSGVTLELSEFGQGYQSMGPAVDSLEKALANDLLRHNGNPVLRWCAANTVVASDPAGNRKFDKTKQQTKRIDGIVAGAMAHQRASLRPETTPEPRIRIS
jgi:phage terminase large subunit-like protein